MDADKNGMLGYPRPSASIRGPILFLGEFIHGGPVLEDDFVAILNWEPP